MRLKKGNLYYWNNKILCEFIGWFDNNRARFKTTNGGLISIPKNNIQFVITEEIITNKKK